MYISVSQVKRSFFTPKVWGVESSKMSKLSLSYWHTRIIHSLNCPFHSLYLLHTLTHTHMISLSFTDTNVSYSLSLSLCHTQTYRHTHTRTSYILKLSSDQTGFFQSDVHRRSSRFIQMNLGAKHSNRFVKYSKKTLWRRYVSSKSKILKNKTLSMLQHLMHSNIHSCLKYKDWQIWIKYELKKNIFLKTKCHLEKWSCFIVLESAKNLFLF